MHWRNSARRYGLLSILLHWGVALTVFGLFGLGLWMAELDLFNPWYRRAPALHQSIGVLLGLLVLLRLLWRLLSPPPAPLGASAAARRAGALMHGLLYLGLGGVLLAGYLLATAEGRGIAVFGWFQLPATLSGLLHQEEFAGQAHRWLAWGLIGLAALHAQAALKHHFVDRDATLRRMCGGDGE